MVRQARRRAGAEVLTATRCAAARALILSERAGGRAPRATGSGRRASPATAVAASPATAVAGATAAAGRRRTSTGDNQDRPWAAGTGR